MAEAAVDIKPAIKPEPLDKPIPKREAEQLTTIVKSKETTETPEQIWQGLDRNTKTVALIIGTMSTIHPDINVIRDMLSRQKKAHPDVRYNASTGIFELLARGVLEQKSQVDIDNEIIEKYKGKTPIPFSEGRPMSYQQEVESMEYTGAKMRQEELKRNPNGHPEWKMPRFALKKQFQEFVVKQKIEKQRFSVAKNRLKKYKSQRSATVKK